MNCMIPIKVPKDRHSFKCAVRTDVTVGERQRGAGPGHVPGGYDKDKLMANATGAGCGPPMQAVGSWGALWGMTVFSPTCWA